jgi:hypothetical protein
MRKARIILAIALVPLCGTVGYSQEVHGLDCSDSWKAIPPASDGRIGRTSLVRGRPYCATVTDDSEARMTNGDVNQSKGTASVCRNSQGAVRRERLSSEESGPNWLPVPYHAPSKMILIDDPANRQTITILPERKFARISYWHKPASPTERNGPEFSEVYPGESRQDHRHIGARSPGVSPDIRPSHVDTQYSEKMVQGVAACGERTTRTYPRGTFDDPKDEQEVIDKWYSPYLDAIVVEAWNTHQNQWHSFDGLVFLRHDVRVTDIRLQEPDPALFAIPKDYEVETQQLP